MLRRSSLPIAAPLAALVASLGCAEAPTAFSGPLPTQGALARGAVVAQATGEGESQLPAGFTPLAFRFSAIQLGNGNANGEFSIFWANALGTNDYRGVVTCVSFDPVNRRAWIGGVVTENNSTHPSGAEARKQPGRDIWFRVVDNGEGAGAAPDRTTVAGFEGDAGVITSAEYCTQQPWAAADANTWPRASGNIQVH